MSDFESIISSGYHFSGPSITLGAAKREGKVFSSLPVSLPLSTLNRHGLVAGATGTGKTKALQHITELLSDAGVPVVVMDIKGDVSGISRAGEVNERITERSLATGISWTPTAYPVEFFSLTGNGGVPLRATVSEFGPVLFSKMLELNETQESVLALIFKFADDYQLPLVDLKDMKKLIAFLQNEGKKLLQNDYGAISSVSTGIILRKIIELEGEGAEQFFGEPSFEVKDFMRTAQSGKGIVSILRLMDMQSKPKLFSTFMLSLISELYHSLPEEGDVEKPKLVLMVDEAHLLFKQATPRLLAELETAIKLIRSKGVGIIFCTQLPTDIPAVILSQLGLKIQFALRAFTAIDRKAIRLAAQNYPETEFYKTDELITALGIGEAFVTGLDEKGNPTPLVHALMASPQSRMDTITDQELRETIDHSHLMATYAQSVDRDTACEILTRKLEAAQQSGQAPSSGGSLSDVFEGVFGRGMGRSVVRSATTSVVRNVTSQLLRGVLGGILGR